MTLSIMDLGWTYQLQLPSGCQGSGEKTLYIEGRWCLNSSIELLGVLCYKLCVHSCIFSAMVTRRPTNNNHDANASTLRPAQMIA